MEEKQCALVLIGADEWGRKEILGLTDGYRESTQSWRELLLDLKRRGLSHAPDLAIGDGALGFWGALREVFGGTCEQRCWFHSEGMNAIGPKECPNRQCFKRYAQIRAGQSQGAFA